MRRGGLSGLPVAILLWALPGMTGNGGGCLEAQTPARLVPGDTVLVVPSHQYEASALHRFLLGSGHRDLWNTPVPVPVLDLDQYAGGLTPDELGGGAQTSSLRFRGTDGRAYQFRSVDKDARRALEPGLYKATAGWLLQDQISSLMPLSAMVVAPLLRAAGILVAEPELRVMPDDPRLGGFRAQFAGMLGWIEERPDEVDDSLPGFAGSDRVVGSDRLFELVEESPDHRVDASAFLRARLLDVLVGDWDRHPDQWRWARFEQNGRRIYEPIPRDRDWALARIDGAITWFSWVPWPQYVGFGPSISSAFRQTWNAQALDRLILPELDWSEWEPEVRDIVASLDDAVVADAVRRLPDAYYDRIGPSLEADLRSRRDHLPSFAREYYELLAGWVDVHATDQEDLARFERRGRDTVRLEVFERDGNRPLGDPWFSRDFVYPWTREVRLDLHGDDDIVEVGGSQDGRIVIRAIGGGSDDRFIDRTSGRRVFFYGPGDGDTFDAAPSTRVDRDDWEEPYDPRERNDRVAARDWGSRTLPVVELSYQPDWGLVAGAGVQHTGYGFRRWPWADRVALVGGLATGTGRFHGYASWEKQARPGLWLDARVEATGAEVRRFYGFGNGSDPAGDTDSDRFHAQRREVGASVGVRREIEELEVEAELVFRRLTDLGNPGSLVAETRPYGYPEFQQAGVRIGVARLPPGESDGLLGTEGTRIKGTFYPAVLDARAAFGSAEAHGAFAIPVAPDAPLPLAIAFRAGAERAFGDYPYHEAAFLGGSDDLRGYRNGRFAGDASVYGGGELRVGVGSLASLGPRDLGVFGVVEAGRVFDDRDVSDTWSTSVGGGVWLSFLGGYGARASVVKGEMTGVYAALGFPF